MSQLLVDEHFCKYSLFPINDLFSNWFIEYFQISNLADGEVVEKVFAPLKVIDAILAANDVVTRITKDVLFANPIEEWEVIISDTNDLTCVPDKTIIHTDEIVTKDKHELLDHNVYLIDFLNFMLIKDQRPCREKKLFRKNLKMTLIYVKIFNLVHVVLLVN